MRLAMTAALAAAVAGCGGGGAGGPSADTGDEVRSAQARVTSPVVPAEDAATLSADNAAFALHLYHASAGHAGNFVAAPASVSVAFAMLFGGARGTTADEIATGLHFTLPPAQLHPAFDALDLALRAPSDASGAFQLSFVNAAWGDRGETFLPAYLDLLAMNYGAGVRVVDFRGDPEGARRGINAWVSAQTANKISELLAPGSLDALTRLVLTNAISFRADWANPFNQATSDGTFHAPSGDVAVKMMHAAPLFSVWTGDGFQAAELPYAGGTSSMLIVVPDAGTFDAFEGVLTDDGLAAIVAGQATATSGGGVVMPGFAFAGELDLAAILQTMGVTTVFTDAADLSGINGVGDLFVTKAVQKAFIAVDQKGTEAEAASGIVVATRAAALTSVVVDRPFLFFIRHQPTGTILFMGRVLDPTH